MSKLLRFLMLACVVQVTGAQGLFKGFTPDENGTNLDTPTRQEKVASVTLIKDCTECPEMVAVPAGSFMMGSSAKEQAVAYTAGVGPDYLSRESPQHIVRISSFAVGRYAVTKAEFATFVGSTGYRTESERGDGCPMRTDKKWEKGTDFSWRNPGFAQGDDHPVVCVSWNDAQSYIRWLNRISGKSYRLLSEAEREYAARGGTQTAFWWGDSITTSQANYAGRYSYNGSPKGEDSQATVPVNSFDANPFGLYNVHGNVWEWAQDCWHKNYAGAPTDGRAWETSCDGKYRVLRGGSWFYIPAFLRSATRNRSGPGDENNFVVGFRLARDLR